MEQPSTPISRPAPRGSRPGGRGARRPAPLPHPTRGGDGGRADESGAERSVGRPRTAAPGGPDRAASAESSVVYRARPGGSVPLIPGLLHRLHREPWLAAPKLTGFGCGVLAALSMLLVGFLDGLLLTGSPVVYGVLFLPACVSCALWVRPTELLAAPVAAPIAYTTGMLTISGGTGVGGRLMNLFTALAVNAGWLYAGTLLACLIIGVRKILLLADAAVRRAEGS